MPTVTVTERSDLPADIVLEAARDFSPRRAEMWPDVHVEHLQIHDRHETSIEVTEGNPWPIGHVWERIRYDWSQPGAVRGTVLDSNLFRPGSTWELWAKPDGSGSVVQIRADRRLRGRGWLLAPFFLPFVPGSAAGYARSHLRHFLAHIPRGER